MYPRKIYSDLLCLVLLWWYLAFEVDSVELYPICSWWRNQMETFSALLATCAGNWPVTGEFPTQRLATWIFGVFFDLRLNKRLSKQWWGWWFETPVRPFWRHCNAQRSFNGTTAIIRWLQYHWMNGDFFGYSRSLRKYNKAKAVYLLLGIHSMSTNWWKSPLGTLLWLSRL